MVGNRSSFDPYGTRDVTIDEMLGTAYNKVEILVANILNITRLADALTDAGIPNIGLSAYDVWLANGHTGSEPQFLDWLKGATGNTGAKGDKGDTGNTGQQGLAGVGIASASINGSGHLILTKTDGSTIDAGLVTGGAPTPAPSLSLSSAVTHAEGDSGTVAFVWTLTLNRDGSNSSFPFSWAVTGNGSDPANAADFGGAFPTGTGTFAAGETTKTITVLATGDVTVENTETFLLTVTAASLNTVTSTGTISNDDTPVSPAPSLSLSGAVSHPEGNSSTVAFVWTLTLNRDGSNAAFPFSWAVTGSGTYPANAADFGGAFPSGSGTFAPGETTKTITVLASGDATVENTETFLLTVTASGLNTVTSNGTITDDDGSYSPSYIGPVLTAQASATTYPPQPLLTTNGYHPVGSKLRVRAATTYANLVSNTSLLIDDASFTLTSNPTTNQNGLWAILAGISSGKTFIDVRVEESVSVFSERSNPIMHGSAAVPAPQASIDFSVYSTFPLSGTITFAEPVYLDLIGDDQLSLQLSGSQPGTSFILQWVDNGTKSYTGYDDFDVNRIYDYILRRRSLADVTANTTGAVTLLDYDTTPDAFSATPVTGATQGSLVPITLTAISGMAAGYGAPLSLTGPWEKFQINQGSGFGADLTSTAGVTLQDGWIAKVFIRASGSFLTLARSVATIGGVSANLDVTTQADPSSIAPTFNNFDYHNFGTTYPATATHNLAMKAGVNVVCFAAGAASSGADCVGATSITLIGRSTVSERNCMYEVVVPTDGTYPFRKLGSGGFVNTAAASVNLASAVSGVIGAVGTSGAFPPSPIAIGSGLTVAAGNLGLAFCVTGSPTPPTWDVGVEGKAGGADGLLFSIAFLTGSGIPTFETDSYNDGGGVAAVWGK